MLQSLFLNVLTASTDWIFNGTKRLRVVLARHQNEEGKELPEVFINNGQRAEAYSLLVASTLAMNFMSLGSSVHG